jgi:hypothetical protein
MICGEIRQCLESKMRQIVLETKITGALTTVLFRTFLSLQASISDYMKTSVVKAKYLNRQKEKNV